MSFARRSFVRTVGLSGAALLAVRRQVFGALAAPENPTAPPARLLLHNNENPLGPGETVLEAVRAALKLGAPAGRYPWKRAPDLKQAVAERFGVRPDNVVLGCGSTQVLTSAVQMYTSPVKPLVSGSPTFELCANYARRIGTPVRAIPLDEKMRLDLDAMAAASTGAGLVFLTNPNNPTATLWSADAVDAFIDEVMKTSPDALVLVDEAYHDYVSDPSHRSQIPRAVENPRVLVARTFSKAHGMAGMRIGYALGHPDTVRTVASWEGNDFLNVPGIIAGVASIGDQAHLDAEAARNVEARRFTIDWFAARGYESTASQGNFIFVDVGRPAKEFRDACRSEGVLVGRDFPPYEKSHARISIGTLDEMKEAVAVFARALAVVPAEAA